MNTIRGYAPPRQEGIFPAAGRQQASSCASLQVQDWTRGLDAGSRNRNSVITETIHALPVLSSSGIRWDVLLITLILLLSLFLFIGFKELEVKNSRIINLISSLTFGIYLIHDNWQIRRYLWNNIVKVNSMQDSPWFLPFSVGVILAVFCVCGLLEFIRQQTAERLWLKVAEPLSEKIDSLIDRLIP